MLELRTYTINEMADILGTYKREGIKRKLNRYGVKYNVSGRSGSTKFEITEITDEFKVFCLIDLQMSANTDFNKFLFFMYYFLNDEDFCWLPDETLEIMMDEQDHHISRQTITNYKRRLEQMNLFCKVGGCVYYFARNHTQILTDEKTYKQAWHEYWENKEESDTHTAIGIMRAKYGGVARKQITMVANGIYIDKINQLNDLVCSTVEKLALSETCDNTTEQNLSDNEQFIF